MRSSAVLFVMAILTFGLAGDPASAGTIMLRGIYSRSALGADCVAAGGTPTPGMELMWLVLIASLHTLDLPPSSE